jgi:glycosyltransferase involved in cell wall biosynthesis
VSAKPLVSVVVPSYNHAAYVEQAVRSALAQEVDGLEVLVVDDGSTDDSAEIVRGIQDPRLRLLTQDNQGAPAAINRGLHEAGGEHLSVLNSDDRYAPGRLAAALAVFRGSPEVALVGSWIELIDETGRGLAVKEGFSNLDPWPVAEPSRTFKADGDLRMALLMQNYWATTSNYVFPSSVFAWHGPFRALRYAHDWDFALRVQLGQPAHLIPKPLLQYRIHGRNTINEDHAAMVYEICWVLAVHLPRYLRSPGFWEAGAARRADQLLRSIHVYGCESVLLAMMGQIHHGPPGSEQRLLDPADPARRRYVDEVRRIREADRKAAGAAGSLRRRLGGLARRLFA